MLKFTSHAIIHTTLLKDSSSDVFNGDEAYYCSMNSYINDFPYVITMCFHVEYSKKNARNVVSNYMICSSTLKHKAES